MNDISARPQIAGERVAALMLVSGVWCLFARASQTPTPPPRHVTSTKVAYGFRRVRSRAQSSHRPHSPTPSR